MCWCAAPSAQRPPEILERKVVVVVSCLERFHFLISHCSAISSGSLAASSSSRLAQSRERDPLHTHNRKEGGCLTRSGVGARSEAAAEHVGG